MLISNHFFYFLAHQRLEPATLSGIVAFILSLLCGALNLIRGFHAIESLLQVTVLFLQFQVTVPIDSTCYTVDLN